MPVEDILDIHNVEDTLTETKMYNTRIWCHYIAWDIRIRLDNLNEVNNGFTSMRCFTQECHNMSKAGIFKISNFMTVQKFHALFIVEDNFLF